MEITIPYRYEPRGYQRDLYNCLADGKRRACIVWHRRAGKDKTVLNLTIKEAMRKVGVYYYFLPTYTQGKKIIWDGIDGDGFKFLNHFPEEIRNGEPNSTEMKINFRNGSIFQAKVRQKC